MSVERAKAAIVAAAAQAEDAAGLAKEAAAPIDAAAARVAATTRGTSHNLPGDAVTGLREARARVDEGLALLASGLHTARAYEASGL